jgi:fatty acid desaturase
MVEGTQTAASTTSEQTNNGEVVFNPSPLFSQFTKIPVQGKDPLGDEKFGLSWFRRFDIGPNGKGISFVPSPVANFLRENIWPQLLNEPKVDGMFMDRVFIWTVFHLPLALYLLLFADYQNHKLWYSFCYIFYFTIWFDQFVGYILSLHCVVHRPIFKTTNPVARFLKNFFIWVLGPMMGETPETYAAHHVNMHHPTNNAYDDLSTTMTYKRDSLYDFGFYFSRFMVVHIELFSYLKARNPIIQARFVTGEMCWAAVGFALFMYRPFAACLIYFLPVLAIRIGMTCGNFGQHSFINDENPFINTNQSCCIINSMYNTVAFNDGYHIQHHEYPIAPFYELPLLWLKMLPEMAKHDSIVFDAHGGKGAIFDFVSIWFLLMANKYDVLADHFVDCRAIVNKTQPRSKEEIIALLKSRTWKVYDPKTTPPPTTKQTK